MRQNTEKGAYSGEWSLSSGPSGGCTVGVSCALAGKTSGWLSGRSIERPHSRTPLQYIPKSRFVSTVRPGVVLVIAVPVVRRGRLAYPLLQAPRVRSPARAVSISPRRSCLGARGWPALSPSPAPPATPPVTGPNRGRGLRARMDQCEAGESRSGD